MHKRTASLENQDLPVKEKKKPYLTEPFLSCVPQASHTKLLEAVRKEGPKTNVGPHQRQRLHSDWKYWKHFQFVPQKPTLPLSVRDIDHR